jgi:hypothetical protein
MESSPRKYLRRMVKRALRSSGDRLSPWSAAVRRLAAHIEREAGHRLRKRDLVNAIVSRMVAHYTEAALASARCPTVRVQDTWRDSVRWSHT